MMFLEEIWSRNFTNLFIVPIKIEKLLRFNFNSYLKNINRSSTCCFNCYSIVWCISFKSWNTSCFFTFSSLSFGITLGLLVTAGLLRYGPSFENIAWASLFFLAPLGCIYYPIEILPDLLQIIAKGLPLVHIFEEMRNILMTSNVSYFNIFKSIVISVIYFIGGIVVFYISYFGAKKRGTLINMGE